MSKKGKERGVREMRMLLIVLILSVSFLSGCAQKEEEQAKAAKRLAIENLIDEHRFEEARAAAIEDLEPEIRDLYYKADNYLGHASHLDVTCNTRIEEVLASVVKGIPAKEIVANRNIYFELSSLYPQNDVYKRRFIYYDRKLRTAKK